MRSGRAVGGACARTATLRVAESTVPPTSMMCPTPSGSPLALSPALSVTEAPDAMRAASDGETLKMMSSAPRSATSTTGWLTSADAPSGALSLVTTPEIGDRSTDSCAARLAVVAVARACADGSDRADDLGKGCNRDGGRLHLHQGLRVGLAVRLATGGESENQGKSENASHCVEGLRS